MIKHKARYLILNGQRTRIDADIAPLIQALHDLGVRTFSSCQGSCMGHCGRRHKRGPLTTYTYSDGTTETYRKRIYPRRCLETVTIAFETAVEATKFINLVYRHTDNEELRDQMRGEGSPPRQHLWAWSPKLDGSVGCDLGDDWMTKRGHWVPIPKRPFKLNFEMLCLFPHSQLQLVTQRVQEALTKMGTHE